MLSSEQSAVSVTQEVYLGALGAKWSKADMKFLLEIVKTLIKILKLKGQNISPF